MYCKHPCSYLNPVYLGIISNYFSSSKLIKKKSYPFAPPQLPTKYNQRLQETEINGFLNYL